MGIESVEVDTRDRVIRLEAQMDLMKDDIDEIKSLAAKSNEVLLKAQGGWWFLLTLMGAIGFLLAKVFPLLPWSGK